LKGLFILDKWKNYANIGRAVNGWDDDGQRIQHFMSDSPWLAEDVFEILQSEIKDHPLLQGGILTLDESGDVCSGLEKAGASRQHIGRTGSVQMGQVGVALGYYADEIWSMVDAELYLPPVWFDKVHKQKWEKLHIPSDRVFKTKPEIGFDQIMNAKKRGLPFQCVTFDALYGRNNELRHKLNAGGIVYIGDIPLDYTVYLEEPDVEFCRKNYRVTNPGKCIKVNELAKDSDFETVNLRHTERGLLSNDYIRRQVWTFDKRYGARSETLLIRRDGAGKIYYCLSNGSADTSLAELGLWRNLRHFAERIFEDVKSESGWADLEARKYRAWMHHTAINAIALWFVSTTKLDLKSKHPRDPDLARELKVEVLPLLSMANVRAMLQATFVKPQLSAEESRNLVIRHLINRSKSTASRLKKQYAKT
jgi:SRSO17 transposase